MDYGTSDEFSPLQTVVMCSSKHFNVDSPINATQAKWHDLNRGPDPIRRLENYEALKQALIVEGIDVWEVEPSPNFAYQVFTRDAGIVMPDGAILARFRRSQRDGEERAVAGIFTDKGVAVRSELGEDAFLEGGDLMFLDADNLAVGFGERTNPRALPHLQRLMPDLRVHSVPLREGVLHLDVVFNVIAPRTALIHEAALPADFIDRLRTAGFRLLGVSSEEQETMGTNVLAIRPGTVIAASENHKTNNAIRDEGIAVIEVEMPELLKGGGGPRCMTLPVRRGPQPP